MPRSYGLISDLYTGLNFPGDKFFQIKKKTEPVSLTDPYSFMMTVWEFPATFSSPVILMIPDLFLALVLLKIGAFKV